MLRGVTTVTGAEMQNETFSNLWRMVRLFLSGGGRAVAVVGRTIFMDEYGLRVMWGVVFIWAGFTTAGVGIGLLVDATQCSTYGEMRRVTTDYRFFTCYVEYKGRFIPIEEYQVHAITNE